MQIERYKNLSYDQLKKLENRLSKQVGFQPARNLHVLQKYETPEEKINGFWRKNMFWDTYEKDLIKTKHFFSAVPYRGTNPPRYGEYKIPLHISLNEDFIKFLNCLGYVDEVEKRMGTGKQKLKRLFLETEAKVRKNQSDFKKKLGELSDFAIEYIDRNSVTITNYNPYGTGESGRKTHTMINLIDDTETAFRGVERGNRFAYEWLISNIFDPPELSYMKTAERLLDELWSHTARLLELSKDYLALQMAVKHYPKKSTKPDDWDLSRSTVESILNDINDLENITHEAVLNIFKNYYSEFDDRNHKKYVFGTKDRLKKKWVSEAISQICENTLDINSLSGSSIKKKINSKKYPYQDIDSKFWD